MIKVRVSSKGQVVIPIEVRTRYGIDTGTELELREGSGYVTLHPLPENPIAAARGFLRTGQQQSLTEALLQSKLVASTSGRGGGAGSGGSGAGRGARSAKAHASRESTPSKQPLTLFDPLAG
jgi:AbrB family looped-hinge helix DNA binding protein